MKLSLDLFFAFLTTASKLILKTCNEQLPESVGFSIGTQLSLPDSKGTPESILKPRPKNSSLFKHSRGAWQPLAPDPW